MSQFHDDLASFLSNNAAASDDVLAAGISALLASRPTTVVTTTSMGSGTGEMSSFPLPDKDPVALQRQAGFRFEGATVAVIG